MNHHDDMHDGMDGDRAFDEHLKRGSVLSEQYKSSAKDEVPPELDHKILLQARAAVEDEEKHRVATHASWWLKWNKPLALAATLMLAFTVVYRVGHQSIEQLATRGTPILDKQKEAAPVSQYKIATKIDQPQPAAGAAAQALPSEPKREQALAHAAPSDHKPVVRERSYVIQNIAPAGAAPAQSATADVIAPKAPLAADHVESRGMVAKKANTPTVNTPQEEKAVVIDSINAEDIGTLPDANVAQTLQRVPGIAISGSSAAAQLKKSSSDPEKLLQHIRDLRKQGKQQEADQAWQAFRKDFPDYPVATDDTARDAKK